VLNFVWNGFNPKINQGYVVLDHTIMLQLTGDVEGGSSVP